MKIYYITLNNDEEAKAISLSLLEHHFAVCTNWFPINCAYRWEGKIVQESEIVLIVKTQEGYRKEIENIISQHINYTNCIAELNVESLNETYLTWLNSEVKIKK